MESTSRMAGRQIKDLSCLIKRLYKINRNVNTSAANKKTVSYQIEINQRPNGLDNIDKLNNIN